MKISQALHTHTDTDTLRITQILRDNALKVTTQRVSVLTLLAKSARPLSVHHVKEGLHEARVDVSTIYRVLQEGVRYGYVRTIDMRHTHAHYEFVTSKDHHHLICVQCGRVEDFEWSGCETIARSALAQAKSFSEVGDHAIELYGVCKTCEGGR
jgi:Fe2+ or Zn2+ uptake regulation protein